MKFKSFFFLALLLTCALAAANQPSAMKPNKSMKKLAGTIDKIDQNKQVLTLNVDSRVENTTGDSGSDQKIVKQALTFTDNTSISAPDPKTRIRLEDLKAGDRVVVQFDERNVIDRIRIVGAQTKSDQ